MSITEKPCQTRVILIQALALLSVIAGGCAEPSTGHHHPWEPISCVSFAHHPLQVDVAIIGGGASGMYAATRLHQLNKTVAVVEPRNQTGGHVDTYTDPATGTSFDVGVLYYHNITTVTDFASYLGIPMESVALKPSTDNKTFVVDFSDGSRLSLDVLTRNDTTAAYATYYGLLSQYPYLSSGFHLPSPVPSDLYLPWSQFIEKHNLGGLAFSVDSFNQGWTHILDLPTLYTLKGFGQLLLQSFITGHELATINHNNQKLFDAAVQKIGAESILLNSHAKVIERDDRGIKLVVQTPCGPRLVEAEKLLITAPPLLSNLEPLLSLSEHEKDIFGRFSCGYYWNAVMRDEGIPSDVTFYNANPKNPYLLADQPGMLTVIPTGIEHLHRVYFGSPFNTSDVDVAAQIVSSMSKVSKTFGYTASKPVVEYIRSHSPYHCTVTADDIKSGFYDRLNSLQGKRRTWYTGATFQAHDSGSIWVYTEEEILPALAT